MFYPWTYAPIIRVLIPFLIGILLGIASSPSFQASVLLLIISLSSIVLYLSIHLFTNNLLNKVRIKSLSLFLLIFSLSVGFTWVKTQKYSPNHLFNLNPKPAYLKARITEPPEKKNKTYSLQLEFIEAYDSSFTRPRPILAKAVAYLSKKHTLIQHKDLEYGNIIILPNKFEELEDPKNPEQFNYKQFMAYRQVYHRAFFDSSTNILLTDEKQANAFYEWLFDVRKSVLKRLELAIEHKAEQAVAAALLSGQKANLSDDLRRSYAGTGAMHVLAVSGLHVGIIFLILSFICKPIEEKKYGKYLRLIIIMAALWTYAFFTGMSPSVFRASTMFSFVLLGQSISRITNVYGSIFTSMIFLLLIDPFLITQVGFQLSYAAVIGIVGLQPHLYQLIPGISNWLLDKAWALTTVSLAAQLATFPLSLLYFNQFPVYFLLSNYFVIPAASLIMYSGFAYLLFSFLSIEFLSDILAFLLDHILRIMNFLVLWVQELPYSLLNGIYITDAMCISLYVVVLSLSIGIIRRSYIPVKLFALSSVALLFFSSYKNISNTSQQSSQILSAERSALIILNEGKQAKLISDSNIVFDDEKISYAANRFLWSKGIREERREPLSFDQLRNQANTLTSLEHNKAILLLNSYFTIKPIECLKPDYLLLSAHALKNEPSDIFNFIIPKKLVLLEYGDYWKYRNWIQTARKNGIPVHEIQKDGSLSL